ncbi:quinoprotein dehydrogenase-associated SoxYZ-like carrier [Thauera sp.]|uniref:quinoprotein dehydrogenase-associated SoxYZ-like carrier n=1 Tax=Thauera sp. TaxID=1905334 RepID=UPI002C45EF04|nr:quinoprotein dehydrogenase-associated SoxYZ-like carrier [Thauera sp.]HRP25856.1 quinoprotein dehydrogenase-associated SoxYZ-like carrier [Thauera sp.]
MNTLRSLLLAAALALGASGASLAQQPNADDPEASTSWQQVRNAMFPGRSITSPAEAIISIEAPERAQDAAIVPVSIRTHVEQRAERYIEKVYLVIDNNPSPVGAVFHFTPASGRADIETRVRVDAYTHVRAIAQMNDGELFMATRFVKASGGCSAPPGKDMTAAMASLGKMRFRVDGDIEAGKPALAQLMISHPNNSGLAMDQLTRLYTPAYFVRRVQVSYAGEPVLSADVDFSISENPNFRFYFLPRGEGELKAEVIDTNDLKFETVLSVAPK